MLRFLLGTLAGSVLAVAAQAQTAKPPEETAGSPPQPERVSRTTLGACGGTLTTAEPTFNRTFGFPQGGGCGTSAVGTAVRYQTHTINVPVASNIQVSTVDADGASVVPAQADTFLALYGPGGFNPAAPCANAIAASDDIGGGINPRRSRIVTTTPLAPGNYTVVMTSFENTPTAPGNLPWTYNIALDNASCIAGAPPADISLVVTDTPDPVVAGSQITYTGVITNNGPGTATDVSFQLTMAAGTTYVSATPSAGGLCATQPAVGGNGLVICTWAGPTATGAGNARTATVIVGVPANTPNGAVLNAIGGSTTATLDPSPANNASNPSTTVLGGADLALTLTDAPDPVTAGGGPGVGQITYTATILNNGPAPAQDVAISLPTAAGTTFISATPGAGGVCGTQPAVGASGALSCTWAGATAAAASRVLTVVVGVPANTANGTIFNVTGTASSPTVDLTPANNTASTTTTVQTSADLAITLTDTPDPVIAGNNLTYNVTVTNNGPSDAQGAGFSLPLPAATTFVSLTATGGTCTNPAVGSGGTVSCTWAGATAPTVSRTATVVARVLPSTAAGNISATASTATTTTDPTAANNTATATTTVQVSADLSIALTVVPTQGPTGTLVNVTATVTNNGPSDAQNVQAAVTLPQPVNIVSSSGGAGGTCATTGSGTNNIVTCTWSGATAPTATRVATIQAVIALNASGVITAVASSPTTDPATPNNTATATVAGVPVVQGIPTMDRIGLILLGGLLLGLGIVAVRRA